MPQTSYQRDGVGKDYPFHVSKYSARERRELRVRSLKRKLTWHILILTYRFWWKTNLPDREEVVSDDCSLVIIIIIVDNRGLNTRWCLTLLLLSLPTAAYLRQRGLTPAGLPHTTAQCHLTILGEVVLFCLNHPSFQTPGSLSFCCRRSLVTVRYRRNNSTITALLSGCHVSGLIDRSVHRELILRSRLTQQHLVI